MRFQQKAFAGSILGVLLLAAVTGAVAIYLGRVHLRRTIEADFASAPALLQGQIERRFAAFQRDVGSWAQDKRYASWLGRASAADVPSGQVAAADLKAAHDGLGAIALTLWDEFQVMNDSGLLLLDARRQDAVGEDRSADPAVRRALSGEAVMRIRGPLLEMAQAVTVEGSVRGVLLAAIPLGPIQHDIELALRAHVELLADASAAQRAHFGVRTLYKDGQTFLTSSVPIAGASKNEIIGCAHLERSLTKELAPLERDLLTAIGFGTIAGLLLAFGLSFVLSRALSAPIQALLAAARKLGQGDFDQRVELRSKDELGELSSAFNQMAKELKHRVFFESALRRYLAAPVVEQLIKEPDRLQLGGQEREVTVLFFDVAGFTKLAEKMQPQELVSFMNAYLDQLVEAIFRHGGTFDKFVGDAVMAFFGAPLPQADHAARACRAAIDMQRSFDAFMEAHPDLRIRGLRARIGICSGKAVLGNLGSTHIMSYTAMGDTVNVAARLEGVNKVYGTSILIAESTAEQAAEQTAEPKDFAVREVDRIRVAGRAQSLRIFELCADQIASQNAAARRLYDEALADYRAQRFEDAARKFRTARELGDGECAAIMADRAETLRTQPPSVQWDGAHNLQSK